MHLSTSTNKKVVLPATYRNFAVHDGGARGEDAFGASSICKSIRPHFYSQRKVDAFEMLIIVEGLHGTS